MWKHYILIGWLNFENAREVELRKENERRWSGRPFPCVVGHGQPVWIGNTEREET